MPAKKKAIKSEKTSKADKVEKKETAAQKTEEEVKERPKETRLFHFAVGRRKTAHATVKLFPKGSGIFTVNEKPILDYFFESNLAALALLPLSSLGSEKDFDIKAKVEGGGKHAQAEAVRHGTARALVGFDNELRTTLKKAGFLTRDARAKERKKYGLKRARKAPQFSKR